MSQSQFGRGRMNAVGGVTLALSGALAVAGCGDSFSGDPCEETHTCSSSAAGSGGSVGGSSSTRGGSESAGGDTTDELGGSSNVGQSGEAPTLAGSGSGGDGSAGAPPSGCQTPEQCSNDDPADGVEVCDKGVCGPGNPPPSVVSIVPENLAIKVQTDASISITFSEALNPATVTAANIQLLDGTTSVPGKLTYANNTVLFVPDKPLSLLTPYKVSVATNVTDAGGAALLEAFSAEFTVRDGAWQVATAAQGVVTDIPSALPLNDAGEVLVSWIATTGTKYCPTTARRFQGVAELTPVKPLTASTIENCRYVQAAGNAGGVAVVAWQEDTGFYAMQFRNGEWDATKKLVSSHANSTYMNVAVTAAGVVHLLESNDGLGLVGWRTDAQGVWSATSDPIISSTTARSPAQMAFDATGKGFAVWRARNASNQDQILFSRLSSTWGPASALPDSTANSSAADYERGAPAVAVDSKGDAMAVWVREVGSAIDLMSSRFAAATWEPPIATGGSSSGAIPIFEPPALVFDGKTFVTAWTTYVSSVNHKYSARYDMKLGTWGDDLQSDGVTIGAPRMPQLGVDAHRNLLLVWPQSTATAGVFNFVSQRYVSASATWLDAAVIPQGQVTDAAKFGTESGTPFPLSVGSNGVGALMWGNRSGAHFGTVQLATFQ